MSLKCITIEVRKNLYCANVYLQFDHGLTETEFVKIHVDNENIKLREYSTETTISLQDHFTIRAQTLSSLVVEENNASFRVTIEALAQASVWPQNGEVTKKVPKLVPELTPSSEVILSCCSCQNEISDSIKVGRVLEFPSGTIDVGEFFCHHGPDLNSVLVPRENDVFYGFYFIVINSDCIKGTRVKAEQVYCRRCLMHFGETILNGKAIKIWTDTMKQAIFKTNDQETMVCELMKKILDDCSVSSEIQIMQFQKAIIQTTLSSRQTRYILLNILERNLDILRNQTVSNDGLNNNSGHIKLNKCKANKVLYQFHEDEGNELLNSWRQDISVHTTKVSPTLFATLHKRLDENSQLLPEIYRYSNEFALSYIFY